MHSRTIFLQKRIDLSDATLSEAQVRPAVAKKVSTATPRRSLSGRSWPEADGRLLCN
jgi:hypothetical protein